MCGRNGVPKMKRHPIGKKSSMTNAHEDYVPRPVSIPTYAMEPAILNPGFIPKATKTNFVHTALAR